MIKAITGVMGAGKSYLAMYILYYNFGLDEEIKKKLKNVFEYKNVEKCLTNIAGCKYDKFENVKKLIWKAYYEKIKELYEIYQDCDPETVDAVMETECKRMEIWNLLVVIDECHNMLNKKDDVLVWYFTYHRHLHHEVVLLTQLLNQVNACYKNIVETFYRAIPSSHTIGKSRVYKRYMRSNLSAKSEMTPALKIVSKQEIFDTFVSGAHTKKDNYFGKRLLKILIAFVVLGIMAYLMMKYGFSNGEEEETKIVTKEKPKEKIPRQNSKTVVTEIKEDLADKIHKVAYCSKSKNVCIFNENYFSYEMFYFYLKETKSKVFTERVPNTAFYELNLVLPSDFFLLKSGDSNDQNNSSDPLASNSFSLF